MTKYGVSESRLFSCRAHKTAFAKTADKDFFSTLAQCDLKEKRKRPGRCSEQKKARKTLSAMINSQSAAQFLPGFFLKASHSTVERTILCPLFSLYPQNQSVENKILSSLPLGGDFQKKEGICRSPHRFRSPGNPASLTRASKPTGLLAPLLYIYFCRATTACAAAKRATGTLNGEQDT